jgi:hypothetical protein
MRTPFLATLFLLATFCVMPRTAHAAQSYDNCTGFIDSVPAVVATQGTWCLRKDLATAMTDGSAIDIQANNVTLDCNDFKLGGIVAGPSTDMSGIYASGRKNITVRHCNVRGFVSGIDLTDGPDGPGGGYLVEDNRLDNNRKYGIHIDGEHSLVRRNRVFDTGGRPGETAATGIAAKADVVVDNIVDGVASASGEYASGIAVFAADSRVGGNHITGLAATVRAVGINVYGLNVNVDGNRIVSGGEATPGKGIYGNGNTVCSGNTVVGFEAASTGCQDIGGNDYL